MTTPQQVILRGSPHVNRFVRNHPVSHGNKKTRDEPKQHLDVDPYPYPSGKSSKKSKTYSNVKVSNICSQYIAKKKNKSSLIIVFMC